MRAFVALELPEAFADEVAALSRRLAVACEGRFVRPGSHHLTLAFLGEVGEADARRAMDALDAACVGIGPLELAPEGLGTFGRGRDVTLWLGIEKDPALEALAGRLRGELAARGLCLDERPFLPHVTLARRARLPQAELEGLVFPQSGEASRVTLFRSILGPEGARHKPLYTAELS